MRTTCFVALLLAGTHSPSSACSPATPVAVLPGLTADQVSERVDRLNSDWNIIGRYEDVKRALSRASTIYIARIVKEQTRDPTFSSGGARIAPLHSIKGMLPTAPKTLITLPSSGSASCDRDFGDGAGARGAKGELIVVFEGLEKNYIYPNGIDSVKVSEVRNFELLDKVEAWLRTQPGYVPYGGR